MFSSSFAKRTFPLFPLAALFSVSIVAFGVYVHERTIAARPVLLQLNQAIQLKEQKVQRWFKQQKNMVLTDAKSKELTQAAQVLLTTRIKSKPSYKKAYRNLKHYFETHHGKESHQHYYTASLLTNGGMVIFSTDPKRESAYQPLQNTTTYFEPEDVDRVIPTFYVSATTGTPSITLATPVLNKEGRRIGVLAIDLDLVALNNVVRDPIKVLEGRKDYLYKTGETYIVGSLSNIENALLGTGGDTKKGRNISSSGISLAMQGNNITGLFLNYRKQPVLASYTKYQNLVLAAEVQQSEIFAKAQKLAKTIFLIGIITGFIISAIILFFEDTVPIPVRSPLALPKPPQSKGEDSEPPQNLMGSNHYSLDNPEHPQILEMTADEDSKNPQVLEIIESEENLPVMEIQDSTKNRQVLEVIDSTENYPVLKILDNIVLENINNVADPKVQEVLENVQELSPPDSSENLKIPQDPQKQQDLPEQHIAPEPQVSKNV